MTSQLPHITVCICTFKRPALLRNLLKSLGDQNCDDKFTFSVVVADNDATESARLVVAEIAPGYPVQITYCVESRRNIARARNKALAHATGDFIALIDDDEKPVRDWLGQLLATCQQSDAEGALGPVRPSFEATPPQWVLSGRFCERPEHPTGTVMFWANCRSGNFLFRRALIQGQNEPFDPGYGTGGEDMDFFRRHSESKAKFVWCNQAVVYETVPASRLTRSYMLKRALLRGRNILKYPDRWRLVAASALATPVYLAVLPVTVLFGQHLFMKYCIKLCDHTGRLLAFAGLNPIAQREA